MAASLLLLLVPTQAGTLAESPAETAANAAVASGTALAEQIAALRAPAVEFLKNTQRDDGSWNERESVGATALAVTALLRNGVPADDPVVVDGLRYLLSHTQDDGGIYTTGTRHRNYDTCLAMLALTAAGREDLEAQIAFLKELQWDEGEGISRADGAYGGAGYGSHERPDLSNTQFFVDALHEAGLGEDDPAMQKALVFLSRAQNREGQHNTMPFAGKVNDGGFLYTPAAGGESKAGTTENGGLRSYGSMTYAGLKSLIYAGLDRDDARVKAASEWLARHYTLEENPGLDQQGLFYYYHTLAKTLHALGQPAFVDEAGTTHDWRADLVEALAKRQQSDGSWINPADRWMEGDPRLVTSYALLALSFTDAPLTDAPLTDAPLSDAPLNE